MEILEDAISRIRAKNVEILFTSGNHDSGVRLGINSGILSRFGLHFRTRLNQVAIPIIQDSEDLILLTYGIPFLEPDIVAGNEAHQWPVEASQSHVLEYAMELIRKDVETRKISLSKPIKVLVAAHAFVQGATSSDSERNQKNIKVGGLGAAIADVFEGADYVALGHVHRPHIQNEIKAPGKTIIRYSGSPIPYSFSERNDVKQVLTIDFSQDISHQNSIKSHEVPQIRGMRQLTGTLTELLDDKYPASEDWIKVILPKRSEGTNVFDSLKRKFPHLLVLDFSRTDSSINWNAGKGENLHLSRPEDVTRRFVEHVSGSEPSAEVSKAIDDCCLEVSNEINSSLK
jgi:exonuclease SbcD